MAELTSFHPLYSLQKSLHFGRLHLPSCSLDFIGTSDTCCKQVFDWFISDLLPLNDPNTPTLSSFPGSHSSCYLFCSLLFHSFLFLEDALGLGLKLPSLSPFSCPHERPPISRKLIGMTLQITLIHTVLLQKNTPSFLCSCIVYVFGIKCGQIFILFDRVQPQSQACSSEVEEAVRENCKAFASSHRSDEEHLA